MKLCSSICIIPVARDRRHSELPCVILQFLSYENEIYQQRYDVLFTHFEVLSIALPRFTFIIHNEFMTEIKTLQQC